MEAIIWSYGFFVSYYCVHVSPCDVLKPNVPKKHIKETLESLYLPGAFLQMHFVHFSYRHETCSTITASYRKNTIYLVSLDSAQWLLISCQVPIQRTKLYVTTQP